MATTEFYLSFRIRTGTMVNMKRRRCWSSASGQFFFLTDLVLQPARPCNLILVVRASRSSSLASTSIIGQPVSHPYRSTSRFLTLSIHLRACPAMPSPAEPPVPVPAKNEEKCLVGWRHTPSLHTAGGETCRNPRARSVVRVGMRTRWRGLDWRCLLMGLRRSDSSP